ncbi:hypothetical protein BCR33DRAFT_761713 [Rhizoclosmatium globosum]|uniref:Uncharacterized protein n=1 Tax=Rhizoclosmatium globosum TaxID=329046 RepID=A0A1Y2D031_9FUNG|nr:hypothetical protein BCR33DRAFT_761713 [Rhizoclosmatium globosum]|eukprot:ORY52557.1 hypothetical protein BCR33DRAFT_761713 [Rhizoclosmatium globosum]
MIDPESENDGWQFACNDFVNKLRFGTISMFQQLSLKVSQLLLLQAKQSEGTKPRDDDCVPSVMASVTSIKNTRSVVFVDYLNVIAGLEDIRFQVDPSAERIVLKSAVGGQETISDEILTSSSTGTLVVTKKDLIWSVSTLDFANTSGFTYTRSSAFRIRHSAVTRFSAVMLKHTEDKRKQSFFLESAKSSLDHLTQMNQRQSSRVGSMLNKSAEAAGQLFTSILNRQTDNKNLKDVRKAYAVVLHTRNEAFKFYPFFDDEASQMLQALTAVTGLSPFKSHEFVQSVLTKRVELTRRQALRQLLDEPSPWIDNNVDLVRIVDALISDTKPQLIVDMERLFHSCKIESEVTKEVTALLRRSWHYTQSDQSRMKILSVIDRILDRVIMRQEDMVFTTTFKWLKHLEETINPYRNPEMLKLVLYLVKRAKMIQIEPLAPLPNDQQESMFDHFDEYEKLLQFQEEVGTKLHDLKE